LLSNSSLGDQEAKGGGGRGGRTTEEAVEAHNGGDRGCSIVVGWRRQRWVSVGRREVEEAAEA
jgi:hypothetical protein